MAVSTTADRVIYDGDGSTTDFPVNFKFLADSHLYVTVDGVLVALNTDYTVTGAGDESGGTVMFTTAPGVGTDNVAIYRSVPLTQDTDYEENDPLPAATLENSFDLATMQIQQIAARVGATVFDPTVTLALLGNEDGWDARSLPINDLSDPTDAQDAATKAYVDAKTAVAGNVPSPSGGDVGKYLKATAAATFSWQTGSAAGVPTALAADADKRLRVAAAGDYELRTIAQEKVSFGFGTAAYVDTGTAANKVVKLDGSAKLPAVDGSALTNIVGVLTSSKVVVLQDQKASGTKGGGFTSGSWATRTLNTEVADAGGLCTLAANQFTLTAGTYLAYATAACVAVNNARLRIQNTTDSATLLSGVNSHSDTTAGSDASTLIGVFTVGASKVLELQHRCTTTRNTDGRGQTLSIGGESEIYATVLLVKIS